MLKTEFLTSLSASLAGLPQEDIDKWTDFYREMIEDRTEDGMTEEEAVADLGDPSAIVHEILSETPLTKLVKEKVRPRRTLKTWEKVLLIALTPLWLVLAAALFAVMTVVYAVIWAVAVALFAAVGALALSGIAFLLASVFGLDGANAVFYIGLGLLCIGLAIFLAFGAVGMTRVSSFVSRKLVLAIKKCFVGKEK